MAEIINLKRARKARVRTQKEAEATAARAKFGTPKTARDLAKARAEKDAETLSGHKKDD